MKTYYNLATVFIVLTCLRCYSADSEEPSEDQPNFDEVDVVLDVSPDVLAHFLNSRSLALARAPKFSQNDQPFYRQLRYFRRPDMLASLTKKNPRYRPVLKRNHHQQALNTPYLESFPQFGKEFPITEYDVPKVYGRRPQHRQQSLPQSPPFRSKPQIPPWG